MTTNTLSPAERLEKVLDHFSRCGDSAQVMISASHDTKGGLTIGDLRKILREVQEDDYGPNHTHGGAV